MWKRYASRGQLHFLEFFRSAQWRARQSYVNDPDHQEWVVIISAPIATRRTPTLDIRPVHPLRVGLVAVCPKAEAASSSGWAAMASSSGLHALSANSERGFPGLLPNQPGNHWIDNWKLQHNHQWHARLGFLCCKEHNCQFGDYIEVAGRIDVHKPIACRPGGVRRAILDHPGHVSGNVRGRKLLQVAKLALLAKLPQEPPWRPQASSAGGSCRQP